METELQEIREVITKQKLKAQEWNLFYKLDSPKDLLSNVTLDEFYKSFPSDVFTQDAVQGYGSLVLTLFSLLVSVFLLGCAPWFVWPVTWVVSGASFAGLFMISHDCANHTFSESPLVNDVVGSILMLPLGFSYESWKNFHQTRQRVPIISTNTFVTGIWCLARGPTFWLASIAYWAQHFEMSHYKSEDRQRGLTSNCFLVASFFAFITTIYWYTSFGGVIKFWLLPWVIFHILLSGATLLPQVIVGMKSPFVVHLVFPEWIEYLTNSLNMVLPRCVAPTIPHYRVRDVYKVMKQQWGQHFCEIKVDWHHTSQLFHASVQPKDFMPLSYPPLFGNNWPSLEKRYSNPISPVKQWTNAITEFFTTVNYLHFYGGCVLPSCLALYGFLFITPHLYTMIWTVVGALASVLALGAGYHRLWSHGSYKVRNPTKIILLLLGTASMQRSVLWWVRDHRAHHKYLDTDKDPYNAKQGFWYSHIGWLLFKSEPALSSRLPINMNDLNQDPLLLWQYDYYVPLSIFVGVIFPALVCCLWGDLAGGISYAAGLRVLLTHHIVFSVNSMAHYWGDAPYSDEHTSRNTFFLAILTWGEGYHNFHHEFPIDYRSTTRFYEWDPNKWLIFALSYIGQTYDLKRAPEQQIKKSEFQMQQKKVDKMADLLVATSDDLPTISKSSFDSLVAEGFKFMIIKGGIYDVSDFSMEHPGGTKIMEPFFGKDATEAFTGGVYRHSNAARNTLHQYKIGICSHLDDWKM